MEINQEAEFVRLISVYDGEIRRYIYTLLPRMADVDDVMQVTAQALWNKFSEYDPERPFKTWACRFAYFEVLKFRRNTSRELTRDDRNLLHQRYAAEEKIVTLAENQGQPVKQLYNKLDRIRARLALCIDERLELGGAL